MKTMVVCATGLMAACVVAADSSFQTVAAETGRVEPPAGLGSTLCVQDEDGAPKLFEAAFEYDFCSAYVWHSAVQNDEMVMQPCVWADLSYFDPFWFGFYVWQSYNLTDRNTALYRTALNETDYGVYGGATLWASTDKTQSFWAEFAHDWFTHPGVRDAMRDYSPDSRELVVRARYANPLVDVYGQVAWMYRDFGYGERAFLYETGFNREFKIVRSLSVGADWCVSFGDRACLSNLYGDADAGIGGTTLKLYLVWNPTKWLSIGCTFAYTGVVNDRARSELSDRRNFGAAGWWGDGSGDLYPRDLLWGGVGLKVKY